VHALFVINLRRRSLDRASFPFTAKNPTFNAKGHYLQMLFPSEFHFRRVGSRLSRVKTHKLQMHNTNLILHSTKKQERGNDRVKTGGECSFTQRMTLLSFYYRPRAARKILSFYSQVCIHNVTNALLIICNFSHLLYS